LFSATISIVSTYALGDIQGCADEFDDLLALIGFDATNDRLWLVGDLVNRGPDSLRVLRTVRSLGDAAICVLGNHDLHLLAVAAGHQRKGRQDTLDAVLAAPDCDELLAWLRSRPLTAGDADYLLVHAGLPPEWTPAQTHALAREVEQALRGSEHDEFLRHLYGNEPVRWDDALRGWDRLRVIVNACTRLRFCADDGTMEFAEKRGHDRAPQGFAPWYAHAHRRSRGATVICGHWSALGLQLMPGVLMLDSGCVWGGPLTAVRLEDRRVYQVPSRQPLASF
jgi:bis(5'-nucleosyl)-tetraphosphatase (symmetrical)